MGLIAKQFTKVKTARTTLALPVAEPWELNRQLRMAAAVRHAACELPGQKLRSSLHRGYDTLGIGSMLSDGESHVWVDQDGLGSWTIKIGMDGSTGIALDWTVAVSVTAAPAGKQVHLETTEYLGPDPV